MDSHQYIHGNTTFLIREIYKSVFQRLQKNAGFAEDIKRDILARDLAKAGLAVACEVPVFYRDNGNLIEGTTGLRHGLIDILVQHRIVLEIKNTQASTQAHIDQLRTYMQNGGYPVGFVLYFGCATPLARRAEERQFYIPGEEGRLCRLP